MGRTTYSPATTFDWPWLFGLLLCAIFQLPQAALAQDTDAPLVGRSVQGVLEEYRAAGLPLVYSSRLVPAALEVTEEPFYRAPVPRLREILEPHGLSLQLEEGFYLVVRREPAELRAPVAETDDVLLNIPLELETLNVTASRYVLWSNSQFLLDQRAIQALPDLGEDPVRSVQRLPGAAASGLSSRSHFRGGENNETAIYLNGLKLLDPFHIRDYHSIFSTIDARAISGVEAYTGGFPAPYGDQMSGVLLFDTVQPDQPLHTEVGLSVYNLSLLNSGYSSGGTVDWLVSGRSSNLDVILNDDLGKPDYFDVFSALGVNLGIDHRLVLNALYSDDQVVVITESDPAELEQSVSDTRNEHYWLTLESQWTPSVSTRTVLSWSHLENQRSAEENDPDRLLGAVSDWRRANALGLQFEGRYEGLERHLLSWGLEARHQSADYDYHSRALYRGFYELYPGLENPRVSDISAAPGGDSFGLFLSDRWELGPATGLELGLRWDRQTFTDPEYGSQLSPRVSLRHALDAATTLRLTWGRYWQSQAIHELQVEDGIDRFFAPQRADHWIAGLQHRLAGGYRLRVEAFQKDYDRPKPRFENLFDPLALIPELAPDRVRLDPVSARARGVEVTLEYDSEQLDAWISYTWSRATDVFNDSNQKRSWDQTHAVQAGLAWRRGAWEIGAALSIHTGWPTTPLDAVEIEGDDGEIEYLPVPGPRNSERLATFAQLDFRVSREFPVKHGRLSAFFEVTNLSNRDNPCCFDYDLDEDTAGQVFLDATEDYWLPLIPAVGVLWEF